MTTIITIIITIFITCTCTCTTAQQLSQSQVRTLLHLQRLLSSPPALAAWSPSADFCSIPPTPSLSLNCTLNRVNSLSITGTNSPLPPTFSSAAFFAALAHLPNLTTLSLVALGLFGPITQSIVALPSLQTINLANNSLAGDVPDLTPLKDLAVLDLSGNRLGPRFPILVDSLIVLDIKHNAFEGGVPLSLAHFDRMSSFDCSSNNLSGAFPSFLLSLPELKYVSLSKNRFTGQLPSNVSCGSSLEYVDFSDNLLSGVGSLCDGPKGSGSGRTVVSSGNCLSSGEGQHPNAYCNDAAIAAVLPSADKIGGSKSDIGLILGVVGGVVSGLVLVGLVTFVVFKRVRRVGTEGNFTTGKSFAPRTPVDARHMSQGVMLGALGMPDYRVFSVEELDEATNCFDSGNLVEDGPRGQSYKGRLQDGSVVTIKALKLKQKLSQQSLFQYLDLMSKLRHRHLVSTLGHCLDSDHMFLVTEYVGNGTLRSHLTECRKRELLKWPQRVSAVIGVARGIQFLHAVAPPGTVRTDLDIENVVLDQTLTAKISNYRLPLLPKTRTNKVGSESPFVDIEDSGLGSWEDDEKEDVYRLGRILLETITGKPTGSESEIDSVKSQLQKSLAEGDANLKAATDPTIRGTYALDSLRTAVELALNCLSVNPVDRPSIDDVLWNLQYCVQVQNNWASSESLSFHK